MAEISLEELRALLARVEAAEEPDGMLDRQAALALGWRAQKVTSLGLNGRTPGRWMWVSPDPPWRPRSCPRMTGARSKPKTVSALRALLRTYGDRP